MGEGKVGENRFDSIIPAEQICVLHCSVCHLGNNKSKEIQEIIPSEQINVLYCSFGFQQNTKKVPPNCLPSPHRGWALCLLGCPLCRRCTPRCNTESNIIRKLILITKYSDQMFKISKRQKRIRIGETDPGFCFFGSQSILKVEKRCEYLKKYDKKLKSEDVTSDHFGSLGFTWDQLSCHYHQVKS